jgi:MoaA/NifB/PqqE/SkfB family radical SAM enzyme
MLPSLDRLGTRIALLSGGEPLLNPQWQPIARLLRQSGLRLWLLTSGLSLAKHARRVASLFETVTVSLDGTNSQTYAAIRGIDAFDTVCEGIEAAVYAGVTVNIRVTVQRANYRELPGFVELAQRLGAHQVSFLAVDVANPHAFARQDISEQAAWASSLALEAQDLPVFEQILRTAQWNYTEEFRTGYIAETPEKLRRLHQYFAALCGRAEFPAVRCNAPELSAVVEATGRLRPCFFIQGPAAAADAADIAVALNSAEMTSLRASIRHGERPECATCVCPLWRDMSGAQPLIPPAKNTHIPATSSI